MSAVEARPGKVFELYRFSRPDGTGKLWAIRANGDGTFTTRWGPAARRDGNRYLPQQTTREIPAGRQGLNALVREKERKGYVHEASVVIRDDGQVGTGRVEHVPPAGTRDAVYYELVPAWTTREGASFLDVLRQLAAEEACALRDLGVPSVAIAGNPGTGFDPMPEAVTIGRWTNLSWFKDGRVVRIEGQVKEQHGPWVLLFLMALARRLAEAGLGTLTLADESGVALGTDPMRARQVLDFEEGSFLGRPDTVASDDEAFFRTVAVALGLTSPSLDLAEIDVEGGSFYF